MTQDNPLPKKVLLTVPYISKGLLDAAKQIAENPAELVQNSPDGPMTIRADHMTDADVELFLRVFNRSDDATKEKMLRFMMKMIKGLSENRQRLAEEMLKLDEMLNAYYGQIGFKRPND